MARRTSSGRSLCGECRAGHRSVPAGAWQPCTVACLRPHLLPADARRRTALVPSPSFIWNWRKLDILPVIPVFNIASALGVPFVDKVRAHAPLHHSRGTQPSRFRRIGKAPASPRALAVPASSPCLHACPLATVCASVSLDSSRAFGRRSVWRMSVHPS